MEEKRFHMLCAGTVAAAIFNAAPFVERKKWASPLDFVPELKPRKPVPQKQQTLDEQIAILTQIMGCGPGKVN